MAKAAYGWAMSTFNDARVRKANAHAPNKAGRFVLYWMQMYRRLLEDRQLDYAIWGHVSDGNLHVNIVPRTLDDVVAGREALVATARRVIEMGGSPLAEHGVGRSAMKQRLLRELYGEDGIEQMRRVKRALDPQWKLSPGVLFEAPVGPLA